MPSITALLHTENDALRLGRALETLYPCDQIVVIDHGSRDSTVRIARQYGARVVNASPALSAQECLQLASPAEWILTLDPCESLTEKLAASLFEWKSASPLHSSSRSGFSVFLREETLQGWLEVPAAQTRLVPHNWKAWKAKHPAHDPSAVTLEGEVLRFVFP
jgi:glycosyltransferase involved in cell wall biosynthesis